MVRNGQPLSGAGRSCVYPQVMADDEFKTELTMEAQGSVECHEPCVPECTREHPWEM